MRVLSIKVPIRKKSGNLFNDPRIYIFFSLRYIYIYIYIHLSVYLSMYSKSAWDNFGKFIHQFQPYQET